MKIGDKVIVAYDVSADEFDFGTVIAAEQTRFYIRWERSGTEYWDEQGDLAIITKGQFLNLCAKYACPVRTL